ncbi:MAG: hypothetical protein GY795_03165 [Desulfobacterales bacterium]|nr:hypothetical protein [Desulfobacterales bacterium]
MNKNFITLNLPELLTDEYLMAHGNIDTMKDQYRKPISTSAVQPNQQESWCMIR